MHLGVLAVSGFMMIVALLAPREAEAADENGFELRGAIHGLDPADRNFPKWTDALRRDAVQRADQVHARSWDDWRAFLATLAGDDRRTIEAVNAYVNAFRFKPDFESYEIVDVWQTPAEFFANAGGDCEDFAIAKFVSLRELGLPMDRARIVILHDGSRQVIHAVLEYVLDGYSVLLDNLHEAPVRWRDVPYYHPIFALNDAHYWTFKRDYWRERIDPGQTWKRGAPTAPIQPRRPESENLSGATRR